MDDFENSASAAAKLSSIKNKQKELIISDSEQVFRDAIDILKEKSSMVGVSCNLVKKNFSLKIRKAYVDLYTSFKSRLQVILDIISKVPEVKIIFLPLTDNIKKYKNPKRSYVTVEGITYPKSEVIIIAAKGYDENESYRKFLGTIIHEFCHFAVHEIFGSFKPYYDDEKDSCVDMWNRLVEECERNLKDFPMFMDIFKSYEKDKWIDELVVRILEFHVKYEDDQYIMSQFERKDVTLSLVNTYMEYVDKQFRHEADKAASLRYINEITSLGDKTSKLHVLDAVVLPVELKFAFSRLVIQTNQTHSIVRYIHRKYYKTFNFKSSFMFVNINILLRDEIFKHVEKALQRRKQSTLIIDGHF